jgi:hypothetical protein
MSNAKRGSREKAACKHTSSPSPSCSSRSRSSKLALFFFIFFVSTAGNDKDQDKFGRSGITRLTFPFFLGVEIALEYFWREEGSVKILSF